MWLQRKINFKRKTRGFHLITSDIIDKIPEISKIISGLFHLFILHTSASITINENTDKTVREDLESFFNRTIPENEFNFKHTYEGPDDMPSHIKSSLLGSSISIPIINGKLHLGTWQGIYLCEHRDKGSSRSLIITLHGE